MEMFRKVLLVAMVALSLIFLTIEVLYPKRSFKKELEYWFHRGKKAAGF
jgi:hypothetical protein